MSSHQPVFSDFIFTPGATQTGNIYGDWASLMNVISTLPVEAPSITFTANFTIPAGTWNIRKGRFMATEFGGAIVVTVPDTAILDNLWGITSGVALNCNPTTPHDTFTFSAATPGAPKILIIALGAGLENSGTQPLITANNGDNVVLGIFQQMLFSPAIASPFVRGLAGSNIIAVANLGGYSGGLPDGWIDGTGTLTYFAGSDFKNPVIAGWVGPAPTILYSSHAYNILYTPTTPADWPMPNPINVQEALDDLAQNGISGTGVANQISYFDSSSSITGNTALTFDPATLIASVRNLTTNGYTNVKSSLFTAGIYNIFHLDEEMFYDADTSGLAVIFNLPLASSVETGRLYCFTDVIGNAGVSPFTVNATGGDLINGAVNKQGNLAYASFWIRKNSNGSWSAF